MFVSPVLYVHEQTGVDGLKVHVGSYYYFGPFVWKTQISLVSISWVVGVNQPISDHFQVSKFVINFFYLFNLSSSENHQLLQLLWQSNKILSKEAPYSSGL